MDKGELDFLVRDTREKGTLIGAPEKCPLGSILTYYDGEQPQYMHLRASMLGYAHINLLSMLSRFTEQEAVRVATNSIYLKNHPCTNLMGSKPMLRVKNTLLGSALSASASTMSKRCAQQGRSHLPSGEIRVSRFTCLRSMPPMHWGSSIPQEPSAAPQHDDPLSRHRLSYLNGGGGSGKTMRAIGLFRQRNPLVFTPTHHLAKQMRTRGIKAQTYHSFFRWSGQAEWTPDRMGQKFIPRVIIWDEVCTVPRPILQTFLEWLNSKGVLVICCGVQGQPPPITGEMPHD
jgi:hypothetical protein